ncbi:MAG: G-D-S-L family lipolytic protein [Candidatus Omnitrophota bacterium]|jgi:lysophospholipase L1-like esterase|nr:MAG: G-D-S-L family lipolytic protein [Candidatus Omnitrophota bacterium]
MFAKRILILFLLLIAPIYPWITLHAAQNNFLMENGETIVFLGDSITQAGAAPEGYVSLFKLACDVNGHTVNVINAGIGGHKSNDMLARLQKDVIDHKPAWVSISCGVNDVWHGEKGVPLPEYKKNMAEIVDRCLQAGIKVLLLTATPIFEDLQSPENAKLRDYNDFLRQLAKDKEILLCDLFQTFEKFYEIKMNSDNLMTTDGVHMNPRGNRIMAAEILRALGMPGQQLSFAKKRWELVNNM